MARTTTTTKATTTKAAKAAKPAKAQPYRGVPSWHAAHAAAVGQHRGNAEARAALQVGTHLAWRSPNGSVAWTKGTNAAMLAHATTLGVQPGQPVHEAMALVIAALPAHATTTALAKETEALKPSA